MVRRSIASAAVLGLCFATPVMAATEDYQTWATISLTKPLSKRVVVGVEASGRFVETSQRLGTVFVRPTIGYVVNDALTLHIGYLRQTAIGAGVSDVTENRFFQQTNLRVGKIGSATVNSRTRIELRTLAGARDAGWRVRERIQLVVPIAKQGTALVLSSEAFVALNSTSWGASAGFDQMRNFIGVSVPVSDSVGLETGFQHRYQRRFGQPDRSDFVVPVTLSVRL